MKKTLLFTLGCFLFCFAGYSQQAIWNPVKEQDIRTEKASRISFPKNYQLYQLDINVLKELLAASPFRGSGQQSTVILPLPDADGKLLNFRIYKAPVLHPGLAAKYPGIESYVGQAINKPSTVVRFSTTLFGLHAMTLTAGNGTHYIDPYTKDGQFYIVYRKAELQAARTFQCLTPQGSYARMGDIDDQQPLGTNDNGNFRVYRLAVVTTIEYSAFHITEAGVEDGTIEEKKEAVLAAIAITMTRVNSMFERDLSVSMQLIANNDEIVFIDSDELDNDDAGALLEGGQVVMTEVIGPDNYDIGHSFGTSGGGLAGGSPCSDFKGSAMTGMSSPVGDPFDIDYVSHEMGHQFGAAHTFNAECGGNRSDNHAYEPGGGTTILGYAGVCDPVIQWNSDAQFHAISIYQMRQLINSSGNCVELTGTGNTPPVANAGKDYTIPKGTAFILEGTATDSNGDALTYDWEQFNNEISIQPPVADATGGPNFRSLPITESPNRFIPRIQDVIAGNLTPEWEVIPNVGRILDFVFTVRDNNINGGESHTDHMQVIVAGEAGPFVITSPNVPESWQAATNKTVTWDVAGTTANGVNTPFVDILLSTDGGLTYPIVLAAKVPNDGNETVIVPNNIGTANRIMVRGHENIFYDISNANTNITTAGSTFMAILDGEQNISVCKGTNVTYNIVYSKLNGFNGNTTFSVTGNPAGSTVSFMPAIATANGTVQLNVANTNAATEGFYTLVITMTSGTQVKTINVYLNLLNSDFDSMELITPENMATAQGTGEDMSVTLSWNANPDAVLYEIQIAEDAGFTNLVDTASTNESSYIISGLEEGQTYFWRVAPSNLACTGAYSTAYQFTTGDWSCTEFISGNIPVIIPDDQEGAVSSQLVINTEDNYTIDTATITLDIAHTWLTDLTVKLISPSGTEVFLFSESCGDLDDAIATFADNGTELSCNDAAPSISGTIKPLTPLLQLNGEPVNGTWTLEVFDTEPWDGGVINSWSLDLCGVMPFALSTHDNTSLNFMMYPNPNNGSFNVQFQGEAGPVTLKVYDMRGRCIYEKATVFNGGLFLEEIKINAQSGMYILNVEHSGKKNSGKIIIE